MRKIVLCVLITALIMTSCGNKENPQSMSKTIEKNTEKPVETTEDTESLEGSMEDMQEEEELSFQDIPNQFLFASGAGAWGTIMKIKEDGSFVGNYHDSTMGDRGKKYPYGTVDYCDFYGEFSKPKKINDYTYSIKVKSLEMKEKPGKKEITDKVRYISTEPYGLENAKKLLIYLPSAPISELPEEFLMWINVGFDGDEDVKEDELSIWGIYNPKDKTGFVEYDEK